MKTKVCCGCKTEKPLDQYYKDSSKPSGRTAACMVCRREYSKAYLKTPRGMSKKYSKFLIYRSSYPEKTNAREKLKAAVQKGEIKKPKICSHCGGSFSTRYMQAHHVDYSKPLEVIWLCGNCHKFKHGRIVDMSLIEPKVTN